MTMTRRQAPDLPVRQSVRVPFIVNDTTEARAADTDTGVDTLTVEGHASVFGYEYDVYGGPARGGWVERIERGAFDATLAEDPDVVFLLNHDGMPLARTKSGTLTLEVDKVGLLTRAALDLANPHTVALRSALDRGDIGEMSFAFRVTEQMWAEHRDWEGDEMSLRKITAVNLNRGDVSAVTFGASDATDIDIIGSLESLNFEGLAEVRAIIDRLTSAATSGGMPVVEETPPGGMPGHLLELLHIQPNPILKEYRK